MGRSKAWYVKASTVTSRSEIASIMVRLMMMINDLSLANDAVIEWSQTTDRRKIRRKADARMYHVRILMGHVYEALRLVQIISRYSFVRDMVMRCDPRTVADFLKIEEFAKSPDMAIMKDFRNMAAFHYDRRLPIESLKALEEKQSDRYYTGSMGDDGLDWYFELGGATMDYMIIRKIFKQDYDRSPERTKAVEDIAMRQQEIARAFTDFAGHFIRHYAK